MKRLAKKLVFVGMSGGVDSSVTAYLLKKKGYDVIGVFMRCYNIDGCAERDAEDARRVAEKLEIPFYTWDFEEEYKKRVVEYMIEGYRSGLTPNPDVECNREIKFGLFLDRALRLGADCVATGHYVRLREGGLFEAKDKNKDQSYFLWTLKQEQLSHCLFPIGEYLKSEVRDMARKVGLSTAEKKDSQGICFLGNVTLDDFLKEYLPEKRGMVLNTSGEKLGEHDGAHFYTIGQRQGIGNVKHQKGVRLHKPLYVVSKDVKTNTVTVAEEGDDNLVRNEVGLRGVSFIDSEAKLPITNNKGLEVWARVRYRQPLFKATLLKSQKANSKSQSFKLVFEQPQKFVAPGQSAVFYAKDGRMIGGGVID